MTSADTVKGPGIQFFWNERQQKGIAHAFRLRPAPAGKSYQLWIIRDGKPESVKVFNSDPDGHALVEGLTLPAKAAGVTQVLLTLEPAGGSPLPTTTPFVGGTLVKS
jgi:anti-sigma-K factor RskA